MSAEDSDSDGMEEVKEDVDVEDKGLDAPDVVFSLSKCSRGP